MEIGARIATFCVGAVLISVFLLVRFQASHQTIAVFDAAYGAVLFMVTRGSDEKDEPNDDKTPTVATLPQGTVAAAAAPAASESIRQPAPAKDDEVLVPVVIHATADVSLGHLKNFHLIRVDAKADDIKKEIESEPATITALYPKEGD